jgi:hypothetical protein
LFAYPAGGDCMLNVASTIIYLEEKGNKSPVTPFEPNLVLHRYEGSRMRW